MPLDRLLGPSRDANPVSVLNPASPSTVSPDAASAPRPSACPGLLRIVTARDGGLCRIKLPGGELSAAQAEAIANASARHATGVIELTNRANLQVRGVRAGHEAALIAALIDAGLGPSAAIGAAAIAGAAPTDSAGDNRDRDHNAYALKASAADDVRNIMTSPTAGRDPSALFDTKPLCAALLTLLQSEARFTALSPKFALLLDGGERLARVDHPHDVWLAATQDAAGEVRFVLGLAGCPGASESLRTCIDADSPSSSSGNAARASEKPHTDASGALASVLPSQVPALMRALLHTFLDLAAADATRMRHLLATHSADALLQHAQTYVDFPLTRDTTPADWRRNTPADASLRLGAHAQSVADTWHVGGQPPLGRIDAATLHELAALAQRHSNGTLCMTPWQSVLLPDIRTPAVPAVLAVLNTLGFACDPADAITRLIACAGSSGCAKSLADTKADALNLAKRLPADVDVHLSGCMRSCAAAHCAPFTLLAAAPGIYDLYRRDEPPGFGQCVAHRLTIEQAADTLARLARTDTNE
ncbi:precorrin-3B synthase [Paraburkholderia dilworthii]|uniref:precorrin-3B synthase n=1 Tax=Paraburkholderia dilworthii TaxID=948106 RepID=UPI00041ADFDB|nr:precorrin-3B synthase [Paraburkholderia dilworthii]